jgi:pyruvoyl-dependent arginine decarboxylase (PvlArgDC)
MSDIRDVDTFFDEKEQKEKYSELIKTVQKRAKDAAEEILEGAKKANQIIMEKLEKNIKLTPVEKKDIINHEQNILRKKLMSELVQTKASMILIKNKIDDLTAQNTNIISKAVLETGYEQVVLKGKMKSNNSMILKLQLQQQYLEGIFSELSAALQQLKEMILIDRVTPISEKITDLLVEVDRLQAESDILAGRVEAQGFGIDVEHHVNAYDNALYHMGLADQNMRYVSSVPPPNQIMDVIVSRGYTFIPPPLDYPRVEYEKWSALGQIVKKEKIPHTVDTKHSWYLLMGTSWCTDVVMTDMRGDAGEQLSSALGIGRYRRYDDTIGTFAFEHHGYVSPEDSADNTVEGLKKMIKMRGHVAIKRDEKPYDTIKKYELAPLISDVSGASSMRQAIKAVYYAEDYEMEAYVTSMIVPEGYCGAVLTACVFDPFTEVTANYG